MVVSLDTSIFDELLWHWETTINKNICTAETKNKSILLLSHIIPVVSVLIHSRCLVYFSLISAVRLYRRGPAGLLLFTRLGQLVSRQLLSGSAVFYTPLFPLPLVSSLRLPTYSRWSTAASDINLRVIVSETSKTVAGNVGFDMISLERRHFLFHKQTAMIRVPAGSVLFLTCMVDGGRWHTIDSYRNGYTFGFGIKFIITYVLSWHAARVNQQYNALPTI